MRSFGVAALLLLVAGLATAQQPVPPPPQTVAVTAQGLYEADPDTANLTFNISAQDQRVARAYEQVRRQTETLRQLLRQNGVDLSHVRLSGYQVQPQMDWKSRKITGYEVAVQLRAQLTDFSKIGPVLDQAGSQGLPVAQDVQFTLRNEQTAKNAAVAAGFRQARAEALALAAAAGERLGALRSASIDVPEPIRPIVRFSMARASALASAPPPPTAAFTPQLITVTASIHADFNLLASPAP